jgi:hypothetical protein
MVWRHFLHAVAVAAVLYALVYGVLCSCPAQWHAEFGGWSASSRKQLLQLLLICACRLAHHVHVQHKYFTINVSDFVYGCILWAQQVSRVIQLNLATGC